MVDLVQEKINTFIMSFVGEETLITYFIVSLIINIYIIIFIILQNNVVILYVKKQYSTI